ncbi:hypothetical protein BDN72DRAFT_320077 [Pluteus cervinus]|uniref:Uncharacterized protein n=1 Tax=Pluteus cervinus TaxID=181527 RepID=A0ACD3AD73_9AGAR|nr:hypothetical protein BDN72DRAFT_320077 [Pluteus cervinus]
MLNAIFTHSVIVSVIATHVITSVHETLSLTTRYEYEACVPLLRSRLQRGGEGSVLPLLITLSNGLWTPTWRTLNLLKKLNTRARN